MVVMVWDLKIRLPLAVVGVGDVGDASEVVGDGATRALLEVMVFILVVGTTMSGYPAAKQYLV
jgi:hypothetical protein